ncbi:MAG TPA: ATP-binding protein, partial [Chloroflexota bacterium]|nr:ATP-binding protein [Chloroflexota bacterium]
VNAVRYTPEGGRVVLGAAWQDQGAGRVLVLEVRDTGSGIAAHEQESIFNPFERGQSGRDGDSTGSGVGLAVVDRLTQALGLDYDVQSVAGQGSQFRILVPQALLRMAPPAS